MLILIGGGNVLTVALSNTGLLEAVAVKVLPLLPHLSKWHVTVGTVLGSVAVASSVSHTVASLILLPIIAQIGVVMGKPVDIVLCSLFASKYKVHKTNI